MSQIELSKFNLYAETGITGDDEAQVPKINMYLELTPGEPDAGDTSRQGMIFAQIVRKRT